MCENKEDSLATPASGGRAPMSDAEVICTWMEPKPSVIPYASTCHACGHIVIGRDKTFRGFWQYLPQAGWIPAGLNLVGLWEVQERLTDEQWFRYEALLACAGMKGGDVRPTIEIIKRHIHATPEQKIKALAAVLRPLATEAPRPDGRGARSNEGANL